ncbi:PDR/VanB family oxidoreductase [Pseudonocardia nematodicida]|uniref:PDR/VanB family oxidoreductase n=1 Tax=Pseudonocardia nematodicida TaxID=1206997 RepID=A0ABV1K566_9PSEU
MSAPSPAAAADTVHPADAVIPTDLDLVVAARTAVASEVVALDLVTPDGATLPPWTPGAHVDLLLDDGLVRSYSLCGDPADAGRWRIAVQREAAGRGGSAAVHERLVPGAGIRVRGPRNHFALVPSASYRFVAGGIGITPLVPMLAAAEAAGADWRLTYGGRSLATMAFAVELRERYGDRVELVPQDRDGLPDLGLALAAPDPDVALYCCGPVPMLDAVATACADRPGALHVERFAPAEPVDTGADTAFEVELAGSGRVLTVPADRSLLDVLEEAGAMPLSSCREGTCGTCETGLLAGEADHRDVLLTAEERDAHETIFPCVSRARCARLVLDL